jgi:hypothetical protein
MHIERQNRHEIEQLNQRGGRTLSVVDLIQAGTLSVPMAAYALQAMEQGASLLTGARPGGAGKTTLMASILHLLPPGVRIVTVDQPELLRDGPATTAGLDRNAPSPPAPLPERERGEPECYLVHEIGDGHWYGYLWGPAVAQYVSLIDGQRRIASCLHADTLEELTGILSSPPLGVTRETLARVGLILFMHVDRSRTGYRRRVATLYEADSSGAHRLVFAWDPASDAFRPTAALREPEELARYAQFIQQMVDDGESDAASVRRKVLAFYGRAVR